MRYSKGEAKSWAREKLTGQWTTMVTPFTLDDEMDENGLAKNIEHVISLGTKGLGFSWNMGEFWSLTPAERISLLEIVPRMIGKRALKAFQVTDTCLKDVIYYCSKLEDNDYDLAILAPPYMMCRTEEQVIDWTSRVAASTNIGIAFYNSPQFGITLSAKSLSKLADIPNVVAIKEASFNMQLSIDTHLEVGKKVVVSTPDEEIFFYEPHYGFHQQVMFANTSDWRFDSKVRHDYVSYIELATRGELERAAELYKKIWPLKQVSRRWWARVAGRTGGALPVQMVKYWGELMGMSGGHVRQPLLPLTSEEKAGLRQDLGKIGLIRQEELPAR